MSIYERVKQLNKSKESLSKELGRDPTDEELTTEGNKEVELIKNLKIDEYENEVFQLRYKLSVKNYNLEKARLDSNMLQRDIAVLIGVGSQTYGQIENCHRYPSDEMKDRIASVLKRTKGYLFPAWLEIFTEKWKYANKQQLVTIDCLRLNSPEVLRLNAPEDMTKEIDRELAGNIIRNIIKDFSLRERRIIEMRFGLIDGQAHDLESMGREFDVTRERIRQIEAKAIEKIKKHPDIKKLHDFY